MKNGIRKIYLMVLFFFSLIFTSFALPEYKTSYLKERVKASYITNNKILGNVKQFFPYIGYLISPDDSTIFFTEDRETGDFYSLSAKRLYQFDGTYLRYLGDDKEFKEKFNNKEKFYTSINAEFFSSGLSFEGKENGLNYYSGKIQGNLIGSWKVILGFDSENKIVSVKESAEGFAFKPYEYSGLFFDCPSFFLFESTSKEIFAWFVDDIAENNDCEQKQFFDSITKNNWKVLYYKKEAGPYLEKFDW